ncbi:MAG TPA: FAD-binding oxidoreductase, partial [Actinobacteria bacterium]|nr:FAD-binding oxidoreductase [Actinomycetota bacterium]
MIGSYDEVTARWGNPDKPVTLSDGAISFLTDRVGPPRRTPAVSRLDIVVAPTELDDQTRAQLISVLGPDGLSVDADTRLAHSGGFSYLDLVERRGKSPSVPDAVAFPASHEQVQDLIGTCVQLNLAIVPFGGGTSVVGGVRPERGPHAGVIAVSFDNMADVIGIDDVDMTVTVGPGITGPTLERLLGVRGLTLGHFPQSWERATIGGYVATRSSGQASAGYGRSDEMVERLRVATP